jgi:hypothetical protein
MKTLFTKIRFILSSVVCIAGAVYVLAANDILQIPTTPADHKATLVDVQLGIQGNGEQWIKMGQNREVLIAGGLIAGEVSKNQIDNSSNATIGGGGEPAEGNLIQGGNNSFIGAGI